MGYSVWDDDYDISGCEEAILEKSLLPEYRWTEEQLAPDECDIESYERLVRIRSGLEDFIETRKNSLLICGKSLGCGKTSWAIKLMLTHIEMNAHRLAGIPEEEADRMFDIALFIPVVPFITDIKQFSDNRKAAETYQRAKTSELVVFDDIASVNMSNYDYNIIYALVETRVLAHLPSIFTTNCTGQEEMEKVLGPRLADRLWNTSTIVEIKGKGFRGSR